MNNIVVAIITCFVVLVIIAIIESILLKKFTTEFSTNSISIEPINYEKTLNKLISEVKEEIQLITEQYLIVKQILNKTNNRIKELDEQLKKGVSTVEADYVSYEYEMLINLRKYYNESCAVFKKQLKRLNKEFSILTY